MASRLGGSSTTFNTTSTRAIRCSTSRLRRTQSTWRRRCSLPERSRARATVAAPSRCTTPRTVAPTSRRGTRPGRPTSSLVWSLPARVRTRWTRAASRPFTAPCARAAPEPCGRCSPLGPIPVCQTGRDRHRWISWSRPPAGEGRAPQLRGANRRRSLDCSPLRVRGLADQPRPGLSARQDGCTPRTAAHSPRAAHAGRQPAAVASRSDASGAVRAIDGRSRNSATLCANRGYRAGSAPRP